MKPSNPLPRKMVVTRDGKVKARFTKQNNANRKQLQAIHFNRRIVPCLMITFMFYEFRMIMHARVLMVQQRYYSGVPLDAPVAEYYRTHQLSRTLLVENGHSKLFPQIHPDYYYSSVEEMHQRSTRFPSVEHRLKVYLSNWYIPPCSNNVEGHVQYVTATDGNKENAIPSVLVQPVSYEVKLKTSTAISVDTETTQNEQRTSPVIRVDSTFSRDPDFHWYDEDLFKNQCEDRLCRDARIYLVPYLDAFFSKSSSTSVHNDTGVVRDDTTSDVPLFLQFGDAGLYRAKVYVPNADNHTYETSSDVPKTTYSFFPAVPVLRKFRFALDPSDVDRVTTLPSTQKSSSLPSHQRHEEECYDAGQARIITGTTNDPAARLGVIPIISIVSNFGRHFNPLNDVVEADIPWEKKRNVAVYRGGYTGRNKASKSKRVVSGGSSEANDAELSMCLLVPRCRLVYQHGNSTLVDAKLVSITKRTDKVSRQLNGVTMYSDDLSMQEMLQYKGIVMIEGNDVSSGMKWSLFSNSVVLAPKPTCTSWAMEELLEPWVHYIPLAVDLSDVEEKVQWMMDHDDEAREIARRGHLWITDMMFHPDAMNDHEEILKEQMQRYRAHFRYNPNLAHESAARATTTKYLDSTNEENLADLATFEESLNTAVE
jgi:Glycosyl transferase family 90